MTDDDTRRINRAPAEEEPEETFECEDCGMEFEDKARFDRHREREKRETFRGSVIGDAILETDDARRGGRLNRRR